MGMQQFLYETDQAGLELLLPVRTSLVTAAGAERQLGYVVSVDLTPGVVGRVGEGAASLRPVSHRGGEEGEGCRHNGGVWKWFVRWFYSSQGWGKKRGGSLCGSFLQTEGGGVFMVF